MDAWTVVHGGLNIGPLIGGGLYPPLAKEAGGVGLYPPQRQQVVVAYNLQQQV